MRRAFMQALTDTTRKTRASALRMLCCGVIAAGLLPAQNAASVAEIAQAIRAGRFDQAISLADRHLSANPGDKRILTLRGIAEEKLNHGDRAVRSFDEALKVDPDYVPALRGAAEIRFRTNAPEAVDELDRLLRIDPSDQTANAMRGVIAWKSKDCAGAVSHFARAGSVLDAQPGALHAYGFCLARLGKDGDSIAVFERLARLNPQDRHAACAIAALDLNRKRYAQAKKILQPFARTPDADELSLLAAAEEGLGQTPAAVQHLREAIVLAPDRAALYVQFAGLSFEHNSFQVGIDMINAGLEKLPRSADLYLVRGILHVQKGEYEQADQDFTRANLLDPHQSAGTGAQALAALQTDRLDQAIESARANLIEHPHDPQSSYVLGEALLKQGAHPGTREFAEARSAAQAAVRQEPSFVAAGDLLSRIYLAEGNTEAAVAECRRVLAINPDDATSLYRLVRALKKGGSSEDLAEVPSLLRRLALSRKSTQQREAESSRYRLIEP